MRLLFFKDALAWPRVSGHDVHTYYMMKALVSLGHEVVLVTRDSPLPEAVAGIGLASSMSLAALRERAPEISAGLSWSQERFRSYWGCERSDIAAVAHAYAQSRAEALVAVGLDALPYLAAATSGIRVWYAADEWFLHHCSLMQARKPRTWTALKPAGIKLAYERAYAPLVDRVWVVSRKDANAMRWLAGMRAVDVVPNGVDSDFFSRPQVPVEPRTCVFWGRLDFEPNIQGLSWFTENVWPAVKSLVPDARLTILGASPTPSVSDLARLPGVTIHANLPDLRSEIARHAVAILPFVTGAGIKNKLLEAASLSMPILCTRRALGGLRGDAPPFIAADDPTVWASRLAELWGDEAQRQSLGVRAREWVLRHHTWEATAREASTGLDSSRSARGLAA
jgi:glycosyltransferase involved in cell wall biosynthesis